LGIIFGILNVIGSSKVVKEWIKFENAQCVGLKCTVKSQLNISGPINVYLDYHFFLSSYFVYLKGMNFGHIFKRASHISDSNDCYPISTYKDYKTLLDNLGVVNTNVKAQAGLLVNEGNNLLSPCGIKAALFDYLGKKRAHKGSITIKKVGEMNPVALSQKDLTPKKYKEFAVVGADDYIDVGSGWLGFMVDRFLSWYLPQVPAFGTKVFWGRVETNLEGEYEFEFDKSRILFT
jgi:hypothetical protein